MTPEQMMSLKEGDKAVYNGGGEYFEGVLEKGAIVTRLASDWLDDEHSAKFSFSSGTDEDFFLPEEIDLLEEQS